MPERHAERRQIVQARLTTDQITEIDLRAATESYESRSDLIRHLIEFGLHKMPAGWTPKRPPIKAATTRRR